MSDAILTTLLAKGVEFFLRDGYLRIREKKRDIPSADGMDSHQRRAGDRLSKSTKDT